MPAFARDQIRTALEKRVDALSHGYRQNVGIIGALGLGKTHLLNSAFHDFSRRPGYICIFVQTEACDYEQLADRWIGSVLTGFVFSEGQKNASRRIEELTAFCEPLIPKTIHQVNLIKKTLRKEKGPGFIKELFALPRILCEETGKKAVLMIEEFQELEKLPALDPFALLGQEIMVEKDTMYIVSSSKPGRAKEIFREKLSLLFGNFEIIELRPFNFEETAEFLSYHFPRTQFTIQQLRFFITLTDGEPLYLDLLLDRLKLYVSSQGEHILSDALIFLAFQEELLDRKGRLSLLFEKMLQPFLRTGKDGVPYLRTLLAVSEGYHRIPQIAAYIGRKTLETRKILNKLVMEDMIKKQGSLYIIEDTLFKFWLQEVFNKRNQLFWPSAKVIEEELYQTLREVLEKICHEEKKSYANRIEKLLTEFRNDIVEIEDRKCRCPQFAEVVKREQGRFPVITAKTAAARWVFHVAHERVMEEDVISFLEDLKKSRKKILHKTMILLGDIDQNAKLMAQAAKIQLWTLRDCNVLLALHNLPKIIPLQEQGLSEQSFVEPELSAPKQIVV